MATQPDKVVMSDYYGSFMTPVSVSSAPSSTSVNRVEDNGSASPGDGSYYGGQTEPMIHYQPPKVKRNRRRSAPGPDHVKHRRTRSGCFTCRNRRVKCDEARPVCNRCRKGQRDCVYPEAAPQSSKDLQTAQRESPTSSNEFEDDTSPDTRLPPILDEDEPDSAGGFQQSTPTQNNLQRINTASFLNMKRLVTRNRETSETPSQDDIRSPSSTLSGSIAFVATPTTISTPDRIFAMKPDWTHLPVDFRVHLDYYFENVTHWKYGVHRDSQNFFQTAFITLALGHKPLLYAVVGFAAYNRMLKNPHGKLQDFLQYYTHSLTLLLGLLKKKEAKHDVATLLTILQLATFEEYLGDYTNLMGHQKAAFEILTQLFTPQSILQTSMGRLILAWYMRFDLLVAPLGVLKTSLPRHWIEASDMYCQARASTETEDMEWASEKTESQLGLISVDMRLLVSRRKAGELTEDEFKAEHKHLASRLLEWRDTLHPLLTNPAHLVITSTPASPINQSKLFSYYNDHLPLYNGPLCFTTAIICEWHSMVLMLLCQATEDIATEEAPILGNTTQHAMAVCEIIEAAGRWPTFPRDLLTMLHPSLSMAAMFLPRNTRHHMWLREQFVGLESCGYVLPLTLRTRLAHLFEDETAVRWWLPNDQGFSPILQSVRAFADERRNSPASAQDSHAQDMKETFDALVDLRLQDPSLDSLGKENSRP